MLPPFGNRLWYSAFWLAVLAIKVAFEYFALVLPLVPISRAIWRWGDSPRDAFGNPTDMYCWGYNRGGYTCWQDNVAQSSAAAPFEDGADVDAFVAALRSLRSVGYRLLALGLRWSTPVLIMQADTTQARRGLSRQWQHARRVSAARGAHF